MTKALGSSNAASICLLRFGQTFLEALVDATDACNAAHAAWRAAIGAEIVAERKYQAKLSDIYKIKAGDGHVSSLPVSPEMVMSVVVETRMTSAPCASLDQTPVRVSDLILVLAT